MFKVGKKEVRILVMLDYIGQRRKLELVVLQPLFWEHVYLFRKHYFLILIVVNHAK